MPLIWEEPELLEDEDFDDEDLDVEEEVLFADAVVVLPPEITLSITGIFSL